MGEDPSLDASTRVAVSEGTAIAARLRSSVAFARPPVLRRPQWLVPSEKVILLKTLYFPTGFFIGRRFTGSSVSAS